jgi:arylsulfatase A-like enzyme
MFFNPAFKGGKHNGVAGLVDIAPTVAELLGKPVPMEWQGENLFSRTESDRVYFFAPWSDYLFGYREGNIKYIYNATKDETEKYDLSSDPLEQNNLELTDEDKLLCHQKMAAWAQYVNRTTGKLVTADAN